MPFDRMELSALFSGIGSDQSSLFLILCGHCLTQPPSIIVISLVYRYRLTGLRYKWALFLDILIELWLAVGLLLH